MSAEQDESSKSSDEKEAKGGKPKQGEPTGQEVSRDSDPPLRGSMADLEQELAQLLDGAPEEEDDDEEDDDAPLVPPALEKPKLEPFDSDPGGLGGSGYDSWGPKIDLSAEVPAPPANLDAESVKAALAAPGAPELSQTGSALEPAPDSGTKSDSEKPSGAKSRAKPDAMAKGDRDSADDGETTDRDPESEVPDTKPSAQDRRPSRKKTKKKRAAARATSSAPPSSPAESKGAFTPLRTVLVVLGLLAFIWLIRSSPSSRQQSESTPPPAATAEAPHANEVAPSEPSPADPQREMAPEPPTEVDPGEPAASASAPSPVDPSSLAGDGPLPFDRVSVLSALGPFAIEASRCRRKPDPSGRVMVNLVIAPNGAIKAIATGPRHSGTKTEECILAKLRRAKLEPHAGGDETIALPVQLK